MPASHSLPRISTNVRFAATALLAPDLAGAWAERLFLTPPRPRIEATALDLIDARSSFIVHKSRHIAVWEWGWRSREASAVLLAHGWGGHAAQMPAFVFALLPPGYSRRFARWHWIPEPVRRSMQSAIEERYGVRWEELEVERVASRVTARALVIHDRDDSVVPWRHGVRVARAWPGARLHVTQGLGHGRILRDETVARTAADFVAGKSSVASVAAPAIPVPAPLY